MGTGWSGPLSDRLLRPETRERWGRWGSGVAVGPRQGMSTGGRRRASLSRGRSRGPVWVPRAGGQPGRSPPPRGSGPARPPSRPAGRPRSPPGGAVSGRPHASQPGGRRGPEGAAAAAGSGGAGGGDPPGSAAAPLWSFLRRRALEPLRGGSRGRPRGRRLPERPGPAREVSGLPERVAGPTGEGGGTRGERGGNAQGWSPSDGRREGGG